MTEKDILLGLLSKTQNKTTKEISSLIYDEQGEIKEGTLTDLLDKDVVRITAIKDKYKVDKESIHSEERRKVLTENEKKMNKFFGLDSDKKGEDLFKEIKTKLSSANQNSGVTEDDVLKHDTYQKLLNEKTSLAESYETKLTDLNNTFVKKDVLTKVESKALAIAQGLNLALSKDPVKAKNQLSLVTDKLKGYDFKLDGDNVVILEDGKVKVDQHNNQINFKDVVTSIATANFDINEGKPNQDVTGNNNNSKNPKKVVSKIDEYRKALNKANTQEERSQITADYNANKEQA